MDFIKNDDIRLACGGVVELSRLIETQRLRYLGHIIRIDEYDDSNLVNQMFKWQKPDGWKRPRGRPPVSWMDGHKRSLHKSGFTQANHKTDWELVDLAARDREEWRLISASNLFIEFSENSLFVGAGG